MAHPTYAGEPDQLYQERDDPFTPPAIHQTQTLLPPQSQSPSHLSSVSYNNSDPLLNQHFSERPQKKRRGPLFWLLLLAVLAAIVVAVVVPVYFKVIKPKQNNRAASADSESSNGKTNDDPPAQTDGKGNLVITGADGSEITMEDGTKFTYTNSFGGFWVSDPKDPFNNNARPNSWTPPLNTSWNFGTDRIFGVNLGGLFVLEPFITPAFYQKYPGTKDEWDLSEAMRADTAGGGIGQLEEHYKTFITEQDIAEIAGAGLNWIRLPVPFWAIDTWEGEPFLAKTSWKYILKVFAWCRKYGIRIKLDLHTIPGSQNGYNHSGKYGQVNFLHGVMGIANAQRALNYIRIFTEFISQPEYSDVVVMFGIVNEALLHTIGRDVLTSFYIEAHQMIRDITGVGKGPYIAIGDGFDGLANWAGFMEGSDRIVMDTHPYFAFGESPNTDPIATGTGDGAGGRYPAQACSVWGPEMRSTRANFGVVVAGEFSNGFNDCGLFLRGTVAHAETPNCDAFVDSSKYSAETKAGLQAYAEASMDALQDWFFWTWKIGNSLTSGTVEAPLWSYKLGLDNGWMPKDPRAASGKCAKLGVTLASGPATFQAWQTGGGDGVVAASSTAQFPWPPASIVAAPVDANQLPLYTATGTVNTLPPPTFSPTQTLDGWANTRDTARAPTTIPGCAYPSAWAASGAAVPTGCGAAAAVVPAPIPTPTPTPTPTVAPV